MPISTSLNKKILVAFKQAYVERRMDVAEHLLCALEELEKHCDQPFIEDAYCMVAESVSRKLSQKHH